MVEAPQVVMSEAQLLDVRHACTRVLARKGLSCDLTAFAKAAFHFAIKPSSQHYSPLSERPSRNVG